MVTKGLKRSTIIWAKLTLATPLWTAGYWLSYLVTYSYTRYYWPKDKCFHLGFAAFCVWLYGLLLIAALLLGSVLLKGITGSLLFTGATVVLMFLLNLISEDLTKSLIITIISTVACLATACAAFNKKQI